MNQKRETRNMRGEMRTIFLFRKGDPMIRHEDDPHANIRNDDG